MHEILGRFAIFWVDRGWLDWVSSVALPPPGGASIKYRLNSDAPILHQRHSNASDQNFRIPNDTGWHKKLTRTLSGLETLNDGTFLI